MLCELLFKKNALLFTLRSHRETSCDYETIHLHQPMVLVSIQRTIRITTYIHESSLVS